MGRQDDIIVDFWRRFTDRRGGLAGTVSCYDELEPTLGEWSAKIRAALVSFLGDFRPDQEQFTRRVGRRVRDLTEQRMRTVLRLQVRAAFYRWLIDRGFPQQTAWMASTVYEFHFDVREE